MELPQSQFSWKQCKAELPGRRHNASYCLCHFPSSLPSFLRLLRSHCPVQKLFADAQPCHCFQTSQADWGGEARPRESRKRPSLQHRPPAAGIAGGQLVPALLDMSRIGSEAGVAPGGGSRGPRFLEEDRVWIIQ
uniref:Uncharacterized protein n=1 Tax=Rhinopithecus bieti TaxID=61621 RepID=A0A2K6M842_RHIBE